jgi:catechol 2,3-dioxygenase-like lactoylglutathione lyase family enzyme
MATAVTQIDHVNVQTLAMAETVRFYHEVFGLTEIDPPSPLDPKRVRWMRDDAGHALFHLTTPGSLLGDDTVPEIPRSTGPIHHVALACKGHDDMLDHLDGMSLPYRRSGSTDGSIRQIFVTDPNGVLLELNYYRENSTRRD